MAVKLKPCPFCGGVAIPVEQYSETQFNHTRHTGTIACQKCGAQVTATWYISNCEDIVFAPHPTVYDLWNRRIDNDGNYCPENCKWATRKEQANNRRTCLKHKSTREEAEQALDKL